MRPFLKMMILFYAGMLSLHSLSAQDPAATLSVRGDVRKPAQWSVEQLKAQFADQIEEVKFTDKLNKSEKTGTGIPLLSLILAADPKVVKDTKWTLYDKMHYYLAFLVILEAGDSYLVFFSLGELMPQFGRADAWLLWDVEEKPLSGKEAPLRLVIPTDPMPDREIYGITKITLVDGIKLADQLEAQ